MLKLKIKKFRGNYLVSMIIIFGILDFETLNSIFYQLVFVWSECKYAYYGYTLFRLYSG